jgi:hypothetical protein
MCDGCGLEDFRDRMAWVGEVQWPGLHAEWRGNLFTPEQIAMFYKNVMHNSYMVFDLGGPAKPDILSWITKDNTVYARGCPANFPKCESN